MKLSGVSNGSTLNTRNNARSSGMIFQSYSKKLAKVADGRECAPRRGVWKGRPAQSRSMTQSQIKWKASAKAREC